MFWPEETPSEKTEIIFADHRFHLTSNYVDIMLCFILKAKLLSRLIAKAYKTLNLTCLRSSSPGRWDSLGQCLMEDAGDTMVSLFLFIKDSPQKRRDFAEKKGGIDASLFTA
jgi:hypothetical protein